MGYYNTKIEPRYFHTINSGSFETIIKNGDLRGENYYYDNIPSCLKDMFPLKISGNSKKIVTEKINGLTVTELYLSKMLKEYIYSYIKYKPDTKF